VPLIVQANSQVWWRLPPLLDTHGEVVRHLDPVFSTLATGRGVIPRTPGRGKAKGTAEDGYLHCGPSGAGHFVKMVHNGIEYGLMAAYAEGLNILKHANVGQRRQTVDAETTPLRVKERVLKPLAACGLNSPKQKNRNWVYLPHA
jgi:hypothetical protein